MQQKIEKLWNDLRPINNESWPDHNYNLEPNEYRFDDLGAIIKMSEYGKETEFGWSVDHMLPLSRGGNDNIENLQLLHWSNNKLKGNDFPTYSWDTSRTLEKGVLANYSTLRIRATFSNQVLEKLREVYPGKVSLMES